MRPRILLAIFLLAWFGYFCHDAVFVRFSGDDMMNLAFYWRMPPVQWFTSQILLWRNFTRPMGAAFYLPLYAVFGLNPLPFHAAMLTVLLANVYLVFRLATLLRAGAVAAGLAALLSCYHAGLSNLTYNTGFIYDVLCGFFYLSALVYYLRIREQGRALRAREIAAFLALYVCALNSKEMAVTLPAVLLLYERTHQERIEFRTAVLAGLVNLPYLYGKVLRPDSLAHTPGYGLELTWARFADFQMRAFRDLRAGYETSPETVLFVWAILLYLALRRPSPVLRFCWVFMVLTPLPIAFVQGRGSACLYIPFIGWATFLAVACVDWAKAVALGRRPVAALVLLGCVTLWGRENQHLKRAFVQPAMAQTGELVAQVIDQFRELNPRVEPHSRIVFLNDPFVDWDMAFIADLWWHDRSLSPVLQRKTPLPSEEIAAAEHVFDWRDGRLIQVR